MWLFSGLKLFGDTYSGLEYDYRGLWNVYEMLEDDDKCFQYQMLLDDWRHRRANREDAVVSVLEWWQKCDGVQQCFVSY